MNKRTPSLCVAFHVMTSNSLLCKVHLLVLVPSSTILPFNLQLIAILFTRKVFVYKICYRVKSNSTRTSPSPLPTYYLNLQRGFTYSLRISSKIVSKMGRTSFPFYTHYYVIIEPHQVKIQARYDNLFLDKIS